MTFMEPMLARAAEESDLETKDWTGWVMEPKHDGMRAIVSRTLEGVEIYSRTGKSQKGKCPHLEESFMALPVGTVLDGEIALVTATVDIQGKAVPVVNFNATMRIMGAGVEKAAARAKEIGKVDFLIFDILEWDGMDVTASPQSQRLAKVDSINLPHIVHNPRYDSKFVAIYNELIDCGVEGAILKDLNGVYIGKRSKCWLKVKSAKTFDVIVTGVTDGQGKYEGQIGAIEFSAYMPDGTLKYVGRCSGMTDEERQHYTNMRDSLFGFEDPTVIEIKANEMVGSGEYRTPRHPQYQHVRVDKNAADCLMEQFKA